MVNLNQATQVPDWEGRKHRRFNLECPVRMKFQSGGSAVEVETTSENVSIGGLLVRSPSAIPQHTPVTFIISIQPEQAVHPVYLVGEGEIVRVESEADATFAIAVQCETPIHQLEEFS